MSKAAAILMVTLFGVIFLGCRASPIPTLAPSPTPPVLPPEYAALIDIVTTGARANSVDVQHIGLDGQKTPSKLWIFVSIKTDSWGTKGFTGDVGAVAGVIDSLIDKAPKPVERLVVSVNDRQSKSMGSVTIAPVNIRALIKGRITPAEFVARWQVARVP